MNLELLFLSSLNMCTKSYKISLIYLSSFHIFCWLLLESQNTESPAIQQPSKCAVHHFTAGASASHSMRSASQWCEKPVTTDFPADAAVSDVLDKQFLYSYFLKWITDMVNMNLAQPSYLKYLKKWYFHLLQMNEWMNYKINL
jgi:hypothetical protein